MIELGFLIEKAILQCTESNSVCLFKKIFEQIKD
jgi:hypothetical protein